MEFMKGNFVAYYRVSTSKQGIVGLGMDAQRAAVMDYLDGGRWKLVGEFTEVETGKIADRPKLAEALALCKVYKAKLIIAKLDRLARNVAFISNLMEAGVEFVAVDFPQANRLTVHILAAVAEHEAEMISTRTKAALAQAKARGVKLGNPRGVGPKNAEKGRVMGLKTRQREAAKLHEQLLPLVQSLRDSAHSYARIAQEFNHRGIPAPRGGQWTATQVLRLMRASQ
jgi:DNA invertase Pin-like site-specific DNA recombinase